MIESIQTRLTKVDYSFKDYVPTINSLKMAKFIQDINNGQLENKTPLIHLKMLDLAMSDVNRVAFLCYRGSGKSTLFSEYAPLYMACYNEFGSMTNIHFIIYVADSIENGVKTMRKNLEYRYMNSEFLHEFIPNNTFKYTATDNTSKNPMPLSSSDLDDIGNAGRNITDIRLEFKNKFGKMFCVKLFGALTGIRGTREYNIRPQMAIVDDIVRDKDAKSDAIISSLEETIHKAVQYALHPTNNKVIWLGTPFNAKDPLYKVIESGSWNSLVLPVCEKFPCSKEEFKGAWEDRHTYEYVKQSYDDSMLRTGSADDFYQELMLQIIPSEDLLINKNDLILVDGHVFSMNDLSYYNIYITTDFAYSEKESADYTAISVWAYTSNKDFMLIDGMLGKFEITTTINALFTLCKKYKPLQVGLEVTGQQGGYVEWIRGEQIKRNIFFDIKEVRPTKDKFSRWHQFVPQYKNGKVKVLTTLKDTPYYIEMEDELFKATKSGFKSKHDDILDTHSQLLYLDLYAPSIEAPNKNYDYIDFDDETLQIESHNNIIRANVIF